MSCNRKFTTTFQNFFLVALFIHTFDYYGIMVIDIPKVFILIAIYRISFKFLLFLIR